MIQGNAENQAYLFSLVKYIYYSCLENRNDVLGIDED